MEVTHNTQETTRIKLYKIVTIKFIIFAFT